MKPPVNSLAFQIMALLLSLLLTPSGQAGNDVMTNRNSDNPWPYAGTAEMADYRFEQRADAAPVIAIHFDHCIGSSLAREKRVAKGILVSRNRILAPADYFIDPCSAPIQLPDSAWQTPARYYCHDQRIKKITHLSLIPESLAPESADSFMPNDQNDAAERPVAERQPKSLGIIRVLNELNFDGSSTIDAVLCHSIDHGSISPKPAVAVVSLSNRGKKAIPAEITVAKTITDADQPIEAQQSASILLLTNQTHFYQSGTSLDDIRLLIAAIGKDQQHQDKRKSTAEPFALFSLVNEQLYLRALVNNGELIDELPAPTDLPNYAQRHPYRSLAWRLSSPLTGTISHALGMNSIPGATGAAMGVLAAAELASLATTLYLLCNTLSCHIPVYPFLQTGLGLVLLNGFYRWTGSEY